MDRSFICIQARPLWLLQFLTSCNLQLLKQMSSWWAPNAWKPPFTPLPHTNIHSEWWKNDRNIKCRYFFFMLKINEMNFIYLFVVVFHNKMRSSLPACFSITCLWLINLSLTELFMEKRAMHKPKASLFCNSSILHFSVTCLWALVNHSHCRSSGVFLVEKI